MVLFGTCGCQILPISSEYRLEIGNAIVEGSGIVNESIEVPINLVPDVTYKITMAFGFLAASPYPYFCANGTGRFTVPDTEAPLDGATQGLGIDWTVSFDHTKAFDVPGSLLVSFRDVLIGGINTMWGYFPLGSPDVGFEDFGFNVSANTRGLANALPFLNYPDPTWIRSFSPDQVHLIWPRHHLTPAGFGGTNYLISGAYVGTLYCLPCVPPRVLTLRHTYNVGKQPTASPFWDDAEALGGVETNSYLLVHFRHDPNPP